jgi:hypothetical protein
MPSALRVRRVCVEVFDDRLVAIDEFHRVGASRQAGQVAHLGQLISRDKVHVV